jgi:hypothetical protein
MSPRRGSTPRLTGWLTVSRNVTLTLTHCWLVVSMHPEGPATGHLDTGFLGFPLSLSKCWDGSQIPSRYYKLLMQPSLSKFIKITPCCRATKLVNFHIISTLNNESWNKILPSLSQASVRFKIPLSEATPYHHVFTFTLFLPERRAGLVWEPSNKMMLFPPPAGK